MIDPDLPPTEDIIGFDLFLPNLQMTHISLIYFVFSNCLVEKVCCGSLIFAARRRWNWTVGPKVILNLGKYIPIFRDGGIFGTMAMLCIKGGPPPPRPPSSDTFFVCGQSSDVCGLLMCCTSATGQGPHPQMWIPHEVLGSQGVIELYQWRHIETPTH